MTTDATWGPGWEMRTPGEVGQEPMETGQHGISGHDWHTHWRCCGTTPTRPKPKPALKHGVYQLTQSWAGKSHNVPSHGAPLLTLTSLAAPVLVPWALGPKDTLIPNIHTHPRSPMTA